MAGTASEGPVRVSSRRGRVFTASVGLSLGAAGGPQLVGDSWEDMLPGSGQGLGGLAGAVPVRWLCRQLSLMVSVMGAAKD